MKLVALAAAFWAGLWFTPDQQGQRFFRQGEYQAAAAAFTDPLWQGAAWYRAGEFDKAAQAFALREIPEARFNQGNAHLMLGQYASAISCYEQALAQRPGWPPAEANLRLAQARAAKLKHEGGEMGDQKIGADEIVFDQTATDRGQQTETADSIGLTDEQTQALWLQRVQTKPADFLKAKFAHQHAIRAGEGRP